uniref:Uncharacterized protein n=1 Tax=Oryza brachyantha TaxID=4533 RepID=J3ND04_ORYBR
MPAPSSSNASSTLATTIMLSLVSAPSWQVSSPYVGGAPITAIRAAVLKKERSGAAAATRTAERKKRRVLKQTSVLRNQATNPSLAATSALSLVDAAVSLANFSLTAPGTNNWKDSSSKEDKAHSTSSQCRGTTMQSRDKQGSLMMIIVVIIMIISQVAKVRLQFVVIIFEKHGENSKVSKKNGKCLKNFVVRYRGNSNISRCFHAKITTIDIAKTDTIIAIDKGVAIVA